VKEQLSSLYDYGAWVNQRLLDTAAELTQAEFTHKLWAGFGSVHLTFAHLLGAEELWFARWQGRSPSAMLSAEEVPTVAALRERMTPLVAARRANLASLDDAEITEVVQWTNMRGKAFALPRWQVILHCANHSTHHRSEIAAMLTQLGHEPDSTDLLEYYLAQAGQPWKPTGR
jgi:uncharacterized damage-inducible protein DinB